MATICTIMTKGVGGTLSSKYSDESITEQFQVQLDAPSRNLPNILNLARAANPTQFPLRGQAWPEAPFYGLYAKQFAFEQGNNLGTLWEITVNYMPLDPGEPNTEGNDNPLLWPMVYGLEWLDEEVAIEQGRNVEAIGSASVVGVRPALTLGAIVNSALVEFDEGLFRHKRIPIVTCTRNVATLDEVYALHTQYDDSTNSDTVNNVGPRRWEYLSVDHAGAQTANGFPYFARTARVALRKTTDRRRNNIGWHSWKTIDGVKTLARINVWDEEQNKAVPSSEPAFLTHAGAHGFDPTTVGFRVLDEKPYVNLLL